MSEASAGWHIDPHDPRLYRYYDGSVWTDHTAPAIAEPAAVVAAAPSAAVVPVQYSHGAVPVPMAGLGYVSAQPGVSPKSWSTASLLSFFLGGWGVDRFYLGNTGMGVAKLLLGWLTLGVWPLIDFIVVVSKNAHDGQGLRVMAEPGQIALVPLASGGYGAVAATAAPAPRPVAPKNLSILSMVLSLSSVVLGWVLGFVYVGLIVGPLLAVAGVVVGIIAIRREPHAKGFWLTGIIVGGIIALFGLISLVAGLVSLASYSNVYY